MLRAQPRPGTVGTDIPNPKRPARQSRQAQTRPQNLSTPFTLAAINV
jgi:hypothetical protein